MHLADSNANNYLPFASEAVILVSLSALCAQVWDLMIHFTDEVEYLWTGKFTSIKGLYFAARYGVLGAQLANQYLSFLYSNSSGELFKLCLGLSLFRTIVAQAVITLMEIILLIRVYALYNKNLRVGYFILTIFAVSTIFEVTGTGLVVRSQTSIAMECVTPRNSRIGMAIFGAGAFLSHSVILVMTIGKFATQGRSGWQQALKSPLTNLLCCEGLLAFCVVIAVVASNIAYEILRDRSSSVTHAMYAWFIALISMAASRFILNMRKLGANMHRQRHTAETNASISFIRNGSSICLTTFYYD